VRDDEAGIARVALKERIHEGEDDGVAFYGKGSLEFDLEGCGII
jgi:hypothetical protein